MRGSFQFRLAVSALLLYPLTLSSQMAQNKLDHKFLGSEHRTVVPFDLYKNQIFVPMQVNGSRPLWFILDTGANTAAIDETLSAELGMKWEGEGKTQGVGSKGVGMKFINNVTFTLPDLEFFDEQIIALDYSPNFAFQGREMHGMFSYDFLTRFVVTLDYEKRQMIVVEPDAFHGTEGEVIPLTFKYGLPYVEAEITVPGNPPVREKFLIDVGSGDTVDWPKLTVSKGKLLETVSGVGLGDNEEKGYTGRGTLRLGKFEFKDIPIHCCGGNELGNHLLGGEVLRRFTVTLDYPHSRMILSPNRDVSQPFAFDGRGLILRQDRTSKKFRIRTVIPGSPAAVAGLQPEEIIEKVNGLDASAWTLESLEEAFCMTGRTFDLLISGKNQETKSVKLVTHDLI